MNGGCRYHVDYKGGLEEGVRQPDSSPISAMYRHAVSAPGPCFFLVSRRQRMNPDSPTCRTASGTQEPRDGVHLGCTSRPPKELNNYSVPGIHLPPIGSVRIWVAGTQADVFLTHFG